MVNPMVMYEEEFNQIQTVVDRLVKDANAKVVFIVDKNGQLIAASGDVDNLDTTSLASLTAGNIAASSMPVFMAIAWGTGGNAPQPIPHASNVLGFIEFGNVCSPGQVHAQLAMFASPPWNGRFNTVQFNPPGYCTPTTP